MHISNGVRWVLRIGTAITLAFIYIPLIVIAIYAFNESRSQAWPIDGFTIEWFDRALNNPGVRDAFWTSMKAALGATAVALLLGTLAALAVARYRFFGRETISFLIILPIALPGIVTGMALNSTFTQVLGIDLSLFTVIVGHATFCIVVVFNNAVARLRRSGTSLEEASMDLGANGWLTFRHVTFPTLRTALVAGALLAFALSLDEIIVTTFTIGNEQTLPIWIFANYARPNQLPIVNVVGRPRDPALDHPGLLREPALAGPGGRAGRRPGRTRGGGSGRPRLSGARPPTGTTAPRGRPAPGGSSGRAMRSEMTHPATGRPSMPSFARGRRRTAARLI